VGSWELRENATELERDHIDILWEGDDRVFDAGECGFGTDDNPSRGSPLGN
jgi:hypothetical protein